MTKKTEYQVFENDSIAEQIINNANEGIVVYGPDLHYKFWNHYMEQLSGKLASDVVGKHPLEVFPFLKEMGLIERLQKVMSGEKVDPVDFPYFVSGTSKKGWTLDSNIALRNEKGEIIAILGTVIDITNRKRTEEKLQESEEKYRQIFSVASDAIILIDSGTGKIIETNKSFLDLYGYTHKEVVNMNISNFSAEPDKTKASLAEMIAGGKNLVPLRYHRKKNGMVFPIEISSCFFTLRGRGVVVGMVRDISEREEANKKIGEKNKELLEVNEEKDKFFSIIAHDLRSPFNSLLGLTEILASEAPEMEKDDIVKIAIVLNKSASNMYNLLENLLEWAIINRGLIDLKPEIFSFGKAVEESVELSKESAKVKGITIENQINEDFQIYGDQRLLKLVVRNLLSNAIKFTSKEGKVTISEKDSVISVADTGIGMDKKMVDTLFQVGTKNGRSGTNNELSSGLGLVLCKEYVEKNGGKIWAESEEGKGSNFYFTIKK